jgi:hypothetical protein
MRTPPTVIGLLIAILATAATALGCDAVFGLSGLQPAPAEAGADPDATVSDARANADTGGGDDAGCTVAIQHATPCDKCELTSCCAQATQCGLDDSCATIETCRVNCENNPGDAGNTLACIYGCVAPNLSAAATWGALYTCELEQCPGPSACDSSCNACAAKNCENQLGICYSNPDCVGYFYCTDTTSTTCASKYPSGMSPYTDLLTCLGKYCQTQC